MLPASAAPTPTVTCTVTRPGNPVNTFMDTRVTGNVTCVHSGGLAVTYSLAKYVPDVTGPFNGKASIDRANGNFAYIPGFYPPDPATGVQDPLPEYSGPDEFVVIGTASDGRRGSIKVNINVVARPHSCDANFTAQTRTMFNNPAGSSAEQYQMQRYLIKMIDCTPPRNPDGSQASIKFSFYSLSYPPIQEALTAAAKRGVSVQALTNSHADKYSAWKQLVKSIGSNPNAVSFGLTCWQGCLTPRTPPVAGGPTAWYDASSTTLTGRTVIFKNRSLQGDRPIVKWKWNFGDGHGASGPGPHRKTYRKPGTYKTSLTVTDSAGVTHTTRGEKTIPDNMEPEYPSLHSKIYMFSTVGTGTHRRQWVAAYSSGNPTYQQSRKGFNNLNIAVGDKGLYDIFKRYMGDMVAASKGQILTRNYFRTFKSAGNASTGARPTIVHLLPQTNGDINRDIIKTIRCRYKAGGKTHRTSVRVSIYVFTRKGVAQDLWRLAFEKGCDVEIVYTQMSQRVKGAGGKALTGYGVADCLSTKPTKTIVVKAKRGQPAKRKTVVNTLLRKGKCSKGTLRGQVPITRSGTWLNRTSKVTGGNLTVRMSCPVKPKYDTVKKVWAVRCIRNDIFTHHKVMMVNGYIRGHEQKYVMTGSANWSSPGLNASDEVITEIQNAPALYQQYKDNFDFLKKVVSRNSKKKGSYVLYISGDQSIDVRGMTDEQLEGMD